MINLKINEKGLSLIEVIISVSILGILFIPIFGLLSNNIRINGLSKDQIIATNLAEHKIEELKFNENINLGKEKQYVNGFVIESVIEIVDRKDIIMDEEERLKFHDLYKLVVEVKKDEKIIEKIFTYRNSLVKDTKNEVS